ncbi:MAG: hypothetical protein ACRCWY_14070, partial [Cellulosilyticaceae bacterium]
LLEEIAEELALLDFILRSGGADGADLACELGCDKSNGKKDIFIPWKGFNKSKSLLYDITPNHFKIAAFFHPDWDSLKDSVKRLHARNVSQILGQDLDMLSAFVVCYTPNGKGSGGTGQALRIAKHYKVRIFDAGAYANWGLFKQEVLAYAKEVVRLNAS